MVQARKRFATPATLATVALAAGGHSAMSAVSFDTPYEVNPPDNGVYTETSSGSTTFGAWTFLVSETTIISAVLDTSSTPTSLLLSMDNTGSTGLNTLAFTAVVPLSATAGLVSFDYNYVENFDSFLATANFGYTKNSTLTLITAASGSSSYSFSVDPGDTFGFVLNSSYYSQASVTITNFSAPVPEPSVLALLATGFAGILGMRRSRRREA